MAATDPFSKYTTLLTSPASNAFSITPNDANELAYVTRAIYVGATGGIKMLLEGDTTPVIFLSVQSGTVLNVRAKKVFDTDTDQGAGELIGLY